MEQDDRQHIIDVSRNAHRAMAAARRSIKAGGTKADAEAAAYEVLAPSFSPGGSITSATMLSSGDSLLSSATDHFLARTQASTFAAMALAPPSVVDSDSSHHHHHKNNGDDDHDEAIIEEGTTTKKQQASRSEEGGEETTNKMLEQQLGRDSPPTTIETTSFHEEVVTARSSPLRRDPSGSLGNLFAGNMYALLEKEKENHGAAGGGAGFCPISQLSIGEQSTRRKLAKDPKGSRGRLRTKDDGSVKSSKSNRTKSSKTSRSSSRKRKKSKASKTDKSPLSDGVVVVKETKRQKQKKKASKRKRKPRATRLRIQCGDKAWIAKGYNAVEPPATGARSYFSNLAAQYSELSSETEHHSNNGGSRRTLSVCIPCFNEDASALQRTIHSLRRSYLPPGVVMEILVVVDGKMQISRSMAKYLRSQFGISVTEDDPHKNPFVTFPNAQTIVVENVSNGDSRDPLTLLIKRTNKRKVNSQKWWLYGHAKDVGAEFVFATDCGIVFDRKCLLILLERMIRQPYCHGLTGYQRVMPSQMQGDGTFELCADPMGFFLRQLQSFDFEMSQSTTKSLVDSLGFIPVLPGPCSLFRYAAFVGVSREYFQLTTMALKGDSSDIVLGNVQLAEDRFPPVLLVFGQVDEFPGDAVTDDHTNDDGKKKRFPVTGFEHDAIFYFEAEKPLGQLVRQRRRWINGAYMAAYWAVKGGWIGKSKQGILAKVGAVSVLLYEILQGAMIRLVIPATLSCGLFFMVRIIPSIYEEDAEQVIEIMNGSIGNPLSSLYGCIAAAIYMGGFAVFMIAHTPRAVPSDGKPGEEVTYHIDTKSAYRPRIFAMGYILNLILTIMFFYVGYGVYYLVGWSGSPIYFRMLTVLIAFPYVVALLDGIINSDKPTFKSFINLILLTPVFLSASLWFYVWFPCYASARISDLSWGNRAAHQDSSTSIIARHRAYLGRVVSVSIVVCNILVSIAIIGIMNIIEQFLSIILFSLLGFNILLHVANLLDMFFRFIRHTLPHWLYGSPPPPLKLRAANADEDDEELVVQDDDELSEGSQDFEVFFYEVDDDSGGDAPSAISSLSR